MFLECAFHEVDHPAVIVSIWVMIVNPVGTNISKDGMVQDGSQLHVIVIARIGGNPAVAIINLPFSFAL